MRLVFFGTGEFAVPALSACAPWTTLVVSQPDRPSGRGMRLRPSPVKVAALGLDLPVETPEKSRAPEFVERLRAENADLLLVASYGQILSQGVLDAARLGGINLHGSILPEYRGAAPIQRCILDGLQETGVTLMHMDKGMDTGDVVTCERVAIGPDETYGELQVRLAGMAAGIALQWLPLLAEGRAPRTSQNGDAATLAPKVAKDEAELLPERSVGEEYNRFRAFTPSPGAFLRAKTGVLRIGEARRSDAMGSLGTVLATQPLLVVAFAGGAMELRQVQPEGKKRMSGKDYANGVRLRPGDPI